jgi:hypothetical protein
MSASNWAVCPRCVNRATKLVVELRERAFAGYGTLPLAEFDALRSEASKPVDPEDFRTFREDYEFYGVGDGKVTASYSGHCEKCGLDLAFRHSEPIPGIDE